MLKRCIYVSSMIVLSVLLVACKSNQSNLSSVLKMDELVFKGTAELTPKKVTPYTSMARIAKYNSDAMVRNVMKKVYIDKNEVRDTVDNLFIASVHEDKLYAALRALDFVNSYALSVLTDNQRYVENNIYAKSAQNLSIAAINLHKQEIFAESKLKEIDRLVSQQEKVLVSLNRKNEVDGYLTEPEINYRKGIEVALKKLEKMKTKMALNHNEYIKLAKYPTDDIKLEGKKFYELEIDDKGYTLELFQDSAMLNRREIALAKEELGMFNAAKARREAYIGYPPVARLDINGLTIDDNRYEQALFDKAKGVAKDTLDALSNYRLLLISDKAKQKAFEELCAVVMTQVEVAYRLMEKTNLVYEANLYKRADLKKQLDAIKRNKKSSYEDKIELLNAKVKKLQFDYDDAQLSSTKATALRSLYYYAGLSPFDRSVLKNSIKEIEVVLQRAFNQDLITMLSNVRKEEKWDDGGNAWAHKDNWLETLLKEPTEVKTSEVKKIEPAKVVSVKKVEDVKFKKTVNQKIKNKTKEIKVEGKTAIQLGAYTDIKNADDDKKEILAAVPSLNNYDMYFEDAIVNGVKYHRLMFKPQAENLKDLCNKIIKAGHNCLLR